MKFSEYFNNKMILEREGILGFMDRINAVESVLDKRVSRGTKDKELIGWLKGMKKTDSAFNKVLDGFIDAINQTPLK